MSKLNFSENLFLDVNELNRFRKFIEDEGYKKIFKSYVETYGIVKNKNNSNFKVTAKNNTAVSVSSGVAITDNLDFILSEQTEDLSITNNSNPTWIVLSRSTDNKEAGVVSISYNGTLTGVNTKFTEVLRGQPNFSTKIKLHSSSNTSEYEVLKVTDDTNAILIGYFIPESGLKYSTIGSFTPGFEPSESNKYIYTYDSFSLQAVNSADEPILQSGQYLLAKVYYVDGNIVVQDKRVSFFNQILRESTTFSNIFSTLVKTDRLLENHIQLKLNHGYKVNVFAVNNDNIKITSGYSNCVSSITDGIFKNFLLYNLKNMKCSKISNNVGSFIYFYDFDTSLFDGEDDLIIVPDFSSIEYKISFSGADTSDPIYHKQEICNNDCRIVLPLKHGQSTIKIEYRLIHDYKNSTVFKNLNNANFTNIDNIVETLSDSDFSVNLINTESTRNYS